ncbi:MAG: hypothetical protein ACO3RU_10910, partial [Planctomycetota bacterium]
AALPGHDGPMGAVEGHDGVFAAALRVITENPTPPSSLEQATEQIRERLGSALPFEAAPAPAGK